MKGFLYRALLFLGVVALVRFFHRRGLTILLYHGVAPKDEAGGIYNYRGKFISPESFEHQLRYLAPRYTILELDDAVTRLQGGTLPKNALAITFDDGYRNFYTHAYPILSRMGIPATMFVATDFVLRKRPLWVDRLEYAIGHGEAPLEEKKQRDDRLRNELKALSHEDREKRLAQIEHDAGRALTDFEEDRAVYAPLSVYEIREMQEAGMSFGAHTRTHPILSRERPEDAHAEIAGSITELQALMPLSKVFAYPNGQPGDWTEDNERATEAGGCIAALTTIQGVNTKSTPLYRLKRMAMDATDASAAFASVVSGVRLFLGKIKHRIYA